MSPLTVSAASLSGGAPVTLGSVIELSVNESLSSPAAAMRCTAAVESFPGELGTVTVCRDGETIFSGAVDKQVRSLSAQGRTLRLEARSRGALLLDNEALPCVLSNVHLLNVFALFCAPYGFTLDNREPGGLRRLAAYTVHKGQSEWDALAGFTRRVCGRTPYTSGDRVAVGPPCSVTQLIIGTEGHPFTRLEQALVPYSILSKVVLRDTDGNYTSAVHNPGAGFYGVQRKRYAIPASEFMDDPGLDANQRIRRSMLGKERVAVTLPGIVTAQTGQEVRVLAGELALSNLMVDEVTWSAGASGFSTELILTNSLYYD